MKRTVVILLLLAAHSLIAQNNTNLGTNTQSSYGTGLTVVGYEAGQQTGSISNIESSYNSFFGYKAGYKHTDNDSDNNTFIGSESGGNSGPSEKGAPNNTFLGYRSGYSIYSGSGQNVFLGANAGYSLTSGSGNIFLGYNAGYSETGSNKLYIDNSNTSSPLIYGDFSTDIVGVNGKLGVGINPSETFHVSGTVRFQSLAQDNALLRVMVTDVNGKIYWRDASSLAGAGDNLGNHSASQAILPASTGSYDLGSSALQFRNLFLSGNVEVGGNSIMRNLFPQSSATYDLGSSALQFRNLHLSGNVGIGVPSPSERLEIAGTAKFTGMSQDNGLTKVLVADNNGKLFWRAASTLPLSVLPHVNSGGALGIGGNCLLNDTNSGSNTAFGNACMYSNTTGISNTAFGHQNLASNTTGNSNSSFGHWGLYTNSTGSDNSGFGLSSLHFNSTGNSNSSFGYQSLFYNSTGSYNTANGASALLNNQVGSYNTASGYNSGPNSSNLSNTSALGYNAVTTASNQVRIGDSNVTSIGGQVSWSTLSDGRFKRNVKADVSGLDFIKQLNPVSYIVDQNAVDNFLGIPENARMRNVNSRKETVRQIGFVAQDVEAVIKKSGYVFSGVEAPQNEKDHYSIRYAEFVVPLVQAVQELDMKTEKLEKIINEQQKMIGALLSTSSEKSDSEKTGSKLYQNRPNPSTGDTEITMDILNEVNQAMIHIYDLSGKTVKQVDVSSRGNGVLVKIDSLTPGIYLYSLVTDNEIVGIKRMLITN